MAQGEIAGHAIAAALAWHRKHASILTAARCRGAFLGGSLVKGGFDHASDIEICLILESDEPERWNWIDDLGAVVEIGSAFTGTTAHVEAEGYLLDIRPIAIKRARSFISSFSLFADLTNANQDFLFNLKHGIPLGEPSHLGKLRESLEFTPEHRDRIIEKFKPAISHRYMAKYAERNDLLETYDRLIKLHKSLLCVLYATDLEFFRGYKGTSQYLEGRGGAVIEIIVLIDLLYRKFDSALLGDVITRVGQLQCMSVAELSIPPVADTSQPK